jgi:tRNA_anti-like
MAIPKIKIMKKTIIIVLAIGLVVGLAVAAYMWNKPKKTADDEKPVAVLTADSLLNQFATDEAAAWAKYKGDKVIQVSGKISDITSDSLTTVLIETSDLMAVINCTMAKDQVITKKVGDQIEIKGICAGYNMDVELSQCVLVQ